MADAIPAAARPDPPALTQDKKKLDPDVRQSLDRLREEVQVLLGTRNSDNRLDKAITYRDALLGGLTNKSGQFLAGSKAGVIEIPTPPVDGGGGVEPDLTPPPDVTGLIANGGFAHIIVEWNAATYTQGHGHQKTNLYGVKKAVSDATQPVFADAVLMAEATGELTIYALPSDLSIRWHLWAKYETNDGVESIDPAGGLHGVIAATGVINGVDLGPLIIEAGHLADGSVTAEKVAAEAIDRTKFANDIEPVSLIPDAAALPTTLSTKAIYWHDKLYRWDATLGAYVATVPTADIIGTLADAQIEAIAASKITGQLTNDQLLSIDAAKITGSLIADVITGAIGGGNLLTNSDFTAGAGPIATSWGAYSFGTVAGASFGRPGAEGVDNGPYQAALATSTGGTGADRIGITQWFIPVGLAGGGPFTLSAYASGSAGGQIGLYAVAIDAAGSILTDFQHREPIALIWTRYSHTFIAPAGTVQMRVYIWLDSVATSPLLTIDKVQLELGDYLTAYAPRPDEILPGTIGSTEIADNAVTTPKIVAGAIVAGKIAANAVSAVNIAAGSITTIHLTASSVTSNEIAANTIVAANIAAGAITATELQAGAVTTAKLAAGAVTAGKIAAHTITAAEIQALSIGTAELAADSVTAGKIAAGAVTATQLAAGAVTTGSLLVTGKGAALNDDPGTMDLSAWIQQFGTLAIASAGDGVSGTRALQIASTVVAGSFGQAASRLFPVSPGRKYRVSAYMRQLSGSGLMYLRLLTFDGAGAQTGFWIGLEGVTISGSWVRYRGTIVAPPTTAKAQIGIWTNYTGGGVTQLQDVRCEEAVDYDLIVDGAVLAQHLAANSIAVGSAAIQNGAITNAMLGTAIIDDAKVANLSAAKLTAGDGTIGGVLKSAGFVPGSAGWIVRPDGSAEFSFAHIRGLLQAGQIAAGYITTTMLAAGSVTAGKISVSSLSAISANIGTITAGTMTAGTTFAGNLFGATGTFSGNLAAAGGTFTGDLSAANGTFNGTLTANALTLAGQALFQPVYASASSPITGNYNWSTVLTSPGINPGPSGSVAITVTADWVGQVFSSGGGGESGDTISTDYPRFRILRNGSAVIGGPWAPRGSGAAAGHTSYTVLDVPGGFATYQVQHVINEGFVTATECHAYYRTILVQGTTR